MMLKWLCSILGLLGKLHKKINRDFGNNMQMTMVEENIIRQQSLELNSLGRLMFFVGYVVSECRLKVK